MSIEERGLVATRSSRERDLSAYTRELRCLQRRLTLTKWCAATTSCLFCPLTSAVCILPLIGSVYCCLCDNDKYYEPCLFACRCTMWIRPPETCMELACTFCTPLGCQMMPEDDTYYMLPPARQKMVELVLKIDNLTRAILIADYHDSLRYVTAFLPKEILAILYDYLGRNDPLTDTLWLHLVP